MRSICKKGSVTLVAVLALCVVASASASAAEWHVGGNALTGSSALAEKAKVEESITFSMIGGADKITCSSVTLGEKGSAADIVAPGSIKTEVLTLGGCAISGAKGCSIEPEIETDPLVAQLALGTFPEDKIVLTSKGKVFMTVDFQGSTCSLAGEKPMAGSFTLLAPTGQEELTEQTITGQGSKESPAGTSFYGSPVYLTGKLKIKLASASKWSYR